MNAARTIAELELETELAALAALEAFLCPECAGEVPADALICPWCEIELGAPCGCGG